MAYTLTEARTRTWADYLDDADGDRYNAAGDYAEIDRWLKVALSLCVTDYVTGGGEKFDEEEEVTTSSETGEVSLAALSPLLVRAVRVEVNTTSKVLIPAANPKASSVADLVERDCWVMFVRTPVLPTSGAHFLVGGADPANTWDAFDDWVCVRAAMMARQKEGEPLGVLADVEGMLRASIQNRASTPRSRDAPKRSWGNLRWSYVGTTLRLVRV